MLPLSQATCHMTLHAMGEAEQDKGKGQKFVCGLDVSACPAEAINAVRREQ